MYCIFKVFTSWWAKIATQIFGPSFLFAPLLAFAAHLQARMCAMNYEGEMATFIVCFILSKFKPRKLIEILFCYVYTFLFPDNYIHGNLKRRGNKSQMSHLWQTSNFIAWTALWVIHELFSNKWICGFLSFIWLWLHAKKLVHFKFLNIKDRLLTLRACNIQTT